MKRLSITHDQLVLRIQTIRSINSQVGSLTLDARERMVLEEINKLAQDVNATGWQIRPSVLGPRSADEIAAELEALVHV